MRAKGRRGPRHGTVGGVSTVAASHYMWWLASRSAGLVAMALVTCSVLLGLAMAARLVPVRRRRDAVRLHEHLALLGLVSIAAHGLLLLPDQWLKPGVTGVAVPFALGYRTVWTGLGVIAGYLAAALGLSFYVRSRIGVRRWRRLHRLTTLVYGLALVHALDAGTDAQLPLVRWALLGSLAPVLALVGLRVWRSRSRRRGRSPRQEPNKETTWLTWRRSTSPPASRKATAWSSLPRRSASTSTPS